MNKLNIFKKYLDMIEDNNIRSFTEFCINKFPEYFWTLKASTSGKNHGKQETLIDHVLGCLCIAEKIAYEQFRSEWKQRQRDQLFSALILHDGWRCGDEGNETRYTQEIIDKSKYDQSLLGTLMTSRDHPVIGWKNINKLAEEYQKDHHLEECDLLIISSAIKFHYGPFGGKESSLILLERYNSVIVQTHNIDMHQTLNQMLFTRKHANHINKSEG